MEDEILEEFVVESTEALDALDNELVALEADPTDTSTLSSIFRRVHTIKGTCGFLGFAKLESVTHVGENLLSKLRDGEMTASPQIVSTLLDLVDAMREMMDRIIAAGSEGDGDYDELLARLSALSNGEDVPEGDPAAAAAATAAAEPGPDAVDGTTEVPEPAVEAAAEPAASTSAFDEVPAARLGEVLVAGGHVQQGDVDRALQRQADGDPRHVGEILVGWGLVTPDQALEALREQTVQAVDRPSVADQSIRVDVDLLDALMNLVGELVLNRNQILQHTKGTEDTSLNATLQRLDIITTELQGSVMQTRMQPIENAWSKYPRVVRDLSLQVGKDVALEMHGKETELDKTLLEAIKDPLTHIVRNAIDHGIETPDERERRGKPRRGTLSLRAFHESGQVNIEISDDGGGINPDVIRRLAIERGVVSAERAERMSRKEVTELIFAPGFSTAEAVSNISGRGVGMDVVKTNIEQIGGTVDLQSQVGEGTTLRVKIPLTLAIIPALVVVSDEQHFAIPQVSLLELVRMSDAGAIEHVHGAPVFRLRGTLLPLVFLNQVLADDGDQVEPRGDHIVVLQSAERTFGLVVDAIDDTAEIVVKPLSRLLRDLEVFSGATIMGDGHVALILDVVGIGARAGLSTEGREGARVGVGADADADGEVQTLLLFELGAERQFALPLSQVARLEEFAADSVERSGDTDVVQYRDEILPLVHVADVLEGGRRPQLVEGEPLRAIVYTRAGNDVALVVGEIKDIVRTRISVSRDVSSPGLSGSVVIDGRVSDVVDIDGVLAFAGMLVG